MFALFSGFAFVHLFIYVWIDILWKYLVRQWSNRGGLGLGSLQTLQCHQHQQSIHLFIFWLAAAARELRSNINNLLPPAVLWVLIHGDHKQKQWQERTPGSGKHPLKTCFISCQKYRRSFHSGYIKTTWLLAMVSVAPSQDSVGDTFIPNPSEHPSIPVRDSPLIHTLDGI